MAGLPIRRVCGVSTQAFQTLFSWAPIVFRPILFGPHVERAPSALAMTELGSASLDNYSRSEAASACLTSPSVSFRFPDWASYGIVICKATVRDGNVCKNWPRHGLELAGYPRWFASKSKRAKSKTEEILEEKEDVASSAKETAVKMMENALDILSKEHSKLRTGRASAGMLDHITVEVHGVRTPLSHVAAVTVSGVQMLSVLPYDASMVKEVEKSILNSPLGLNPQVQGSTLTVPLPMLTKEHCETMCKLAGKAGESAKLTLRRARKEALDSVKHSGNLSKDENKRFEKDVEELTKKYTKIVDETCKTKEKEIMA